MKLLNSITILLLLSLTVTAQQADTVKQKRSFLPTGIRVGTDAIALVKSAYDKTFQGWEVNADVDFDRYYLAVEYGNWARTLPSIRQRYSNDGTYFRAGIDVNFLLKDPERNMFFIGARYGRSTFSEHLVINKTDTLWGPVNFDLNNTDVNARWYELTGGIKVKVWKFIWMGYTARFKFGLHTNEQGDITPHDVPGYGRTDKESYWGFNYQVMIRIPVRKQPSISEPKKK